MITSRPALGRAQPLIGALVRLHPRPFVLATLGGALHGILVVATSYALGRVVDAVIIPRLAATPSAAGSLALATLALLLVGLAAAAASILRRAMSVVARIRFDASLREQVVRRFQQLPYRHFLDHPTGELLAHVSADPEAAAEMAARVPHVAGMSVLFAVALAWMLLTDPILAAVGLAVVPALLLFNAFYQRRVAAPTERAQDQLGRLSALAHASFDGALVIKVLGRQEAETARFRAEAERLRDANVEVWSESATFDAFLESIPALTTILVLGVGGWRVKHGAITTGTMFSFINLFTMLRYPIITLGYLLGNMARSLAGYERVRRVVDLVPPPAPRGTSRLPAGPLDLEAAGLGFAYQPGAPLLHEVAFRLPAGGTLAVVGATGAGKSTLLLLLSRLLAPDAGRLRLGGIDLGALTAAELTAAAATVFQDSFLFAGTLAENILLGATGGDGRLAEALRLAHADEFVDGLPAGVATLVGERGVTLSGGQRQRIALARALVRRPRLLLLDDALAAVDAITEARILHNLAGHAGATKVVVASRPSTIALADVVLYLERDRPASVGSHQQLLARVPGYERLLRAYQLGRAS